MVTAVGYLPLFLTFLLFSATLRLCVKTVGNTMLRTSPPPSRDREKSVEYPAQTTARGNDGLR